ncbi:hypothetical protein AN1V17_11790 [Vallitalea sediminicola]
MISINDIYKAIKTTVINGLSNTKYNDVEFSSTDITEKIIRACFYLNYASNTIKQANSNSKDRVLDVELFFFAETRDSSRIDIMAMEILLEDILLKDIKVNDRFFIPVNNVNFRIEKEQGYLIATFELHTIELIEDTSKHDPLEKLEINK